MVGRKNQLEINNDRSRATGKGAARSQKQKIQSYNRDSDGVLDRKLIQR